MVLVFIVRMKPKGEVVWVANVRFSNGFPW